MASESLSACLPRAAGWPRSPGAACRARDRRCRRRWSTEGLRGGGARPAPASRPAGLRRAREHVRARRGRGRVLAGVEQEQERGEREAARERRSTSGVRERNAPPGEERDAGVAPPRTAASPDSRCRARRPRRSPWPGPARRRSRRPPSIGRRPQARRRAPRPAAPAPAAAGERHQRPHESPGRDGQTGRLLHGPRERAVPQRAAAPPSSGPHTDGPPLRARTSWSHRKTESSAPATPSPTSAASDGPLGGAGASAGRGRVAARPSASWSLSQDEAQARGAAARTPSAEAVGSAGSRVSGSPSESTRTSIRRRLGERLAHHRVAGSDVERERERGGAAA